MTSVGGCGPSPGTSEEPRHLRGGHPAVVMPELTLSPRAPVFWYVFDDRRAEEQQCPESGVGPGLGNTR